MLFNIWVLLFFGFVSLNLSTEVSLNDANACYQIHGLPGVVLAFKYHVPYPPPNYLHLNITYEHQVLLPVVLTISRVKIYHLVLNSTVCKTTVSFVYKHPDVWTNVSFTVRLHATFPVLSSFFFSVQRPTDQFVLLDDVIGWMSMFLSFCTSGLNEFDKPATLEVFNPRESLPSHNEGLRPLCVVGFEFFRYAVYALLINIPPGQSISSVFSVKYTVGEQYTNSYSQSREFTSGAYIFDCTVHSETHVDPVYFVHSNYAKLLFFSVTFKDPFGEFETRIFTGKYGKTEQLVSFVSSTTFLHNLILIPVVQCTRRPNFALTGNNVLAAFTHLPHVRLCFRRTAVDVYVEYVDFGNITASYAYTMPVESSEESNYIRVKIAPNSHPVCDKLVSNLDESVDLGLVDKYLLS